MHILFQGGSTVVFKVFECSVCLSVVIDIIELVDVSLMVTLLGKS